MTGSRTADTTPLLARATNVSTVPLVNAWSAALFYSVLTAALTWPLVTALDSSIPWDMGDPLLNSWILAWSADHLWRFLTGEWSAFTGYWNANIFHPSPLALAYSEHLFAQAVQILPVWALTKNPVLCYNLVFLSTFVLSGLGAFLFVRRLTGDAYAALAAGLFYAFVPYRIPQFSHVQVLSSQWMPFVLYGLRVFLDTGRRRALAGATAAWIAQNLSCGYYLIFFAPLLAIYVACELTARHRWRDRRTLALLAASAIVTLAATYPFLAPYLELRRIEFPARPIEEVRAFSADLLAYATADPAQWLWGSRLRAFPKAEGDAFLGVVPTTLAAIGVVAAAVRAARSTSAGAASGWRRVAASLAAAAVVASIAIALIVLLTGGISWRVATFRVRAHSLSTLLWWMAGGVAALMVVSRRFRATARRFARTDTAWFALLLLTTVVLSCGPEIQVGGRTVIAQAPYLWLYERVPGFDGLRVPARFAMLAALWLSVLAGGCLAALLRRTSRPAVLATAVMALFLAEAGAAPLALDPVTPAGTLASPRRYLFGRGGVPAVYRTIATLPAETVIAELPLGNPTWDLRYVFYSAYHWRPLVNGYSGGFPRQYLATVGALTDLRLPDVGWRRLVRAGTTHVVLHRGAYSREDAQRIEAWLVGHGARRLAAFDQDVLFQLPPKAADATP
jgi:hypothetical protein